ncbi:MAG: fasciclin, partial [Okeania sp. SIO2H7]|nr:fasciclin [Okeania sp. SIO2H7]
PLRKRRRTRANGGNGQSALLPHYDRGLAEIGPARELAADTYTVLVPTDRAFNKLPREVRDNLFEPGNSRILEQVLAYHLIPGRVREREIYAQELETLQGSTISINGNPNANELMLNDANASNTPLAAANYSVIIEIDKVLLPPGLIPLGAMPNNSPFPQTNTSLPTNPNPGSLGSGPSSIATGTKFVCEGGIDGLPTTYALTSRGNVPVITWYSNFFSSGGYTPEKRCQQVTSRFENFYQTGQLNYITTGTVNAQPVVCATGVNGGSCTGENVLFTLKPGSDPVATVEQLFNLRAGASSTPLFESEDDVDYIYIDFREFLNSVPPVADRSLPVREPVAPPSRGQNSGQPTSPPGDWNW